MPRAARLDLPGVAQHVVQRGIDRQPCFFCEADHWHCPPCTRPGAVLRSQRIRQPG